MLSRVQSLGQLKILDKMDPAKIHVNEKVIAEAKRMLRVSINKKPCNCCLLYTSDAADE